MVTEIEMSPELAKALHRQNELDRAGAGQKSPVSGFIYNGVQLESRWAVLSELETMKSVVNSMPELMARRLETVWCDSKAGATYSITIRSGLWSPNLPQAISDAVKKASGGYNGIYIEADGGNGCTIEPDWGEDDI